MEISSTQLQGTCELLDTSLEDLQEFVAQFNSAIANEFRTTQDQTVSYIADPDNIKRNGACLEVKWRVDLPEMRAEEGKATFSLADRQLQLRSVGEGDLLQAKEGDEL
jgi:hypothetical protein